MIHILNKIEKYGFNKKFIYEEDVSLICEAEGIDLRENEDFTAYLVIDGKPYICVSRKKRGIYKLHAMLHELGHHFFHYGNSPDQIYFLNSGNSREEFEADAVATIGLVPSFALKSHDFVEEHPNPFAQKIFKDRTVLKFLYGVK